MESTNLLNILKTCRLSRNLTEQEQYLLLHYGRLSLFRQGETIYKKDEFSRGMFGIIISGRVGIIADNGQVVKGMGVAEILGEAGVVSPQNKRTATVRAIQDTEILEWDIEIVKAKVPELLDRLKDLAWKNVSNFYEAGSK